MAFLFLFGLGGSEWDISAHFGVPGAIRNLRPNENPDLYRIHFRKDRSLLRISRNAKWKNLSLAVAFPIIGIVTSFACLELLWRVRVFAAAVSLAFWMDSNVYDIVPEEDFPMKRTGNTYKQAPSEFSILLIRPSKYDDDGYVIRYLRGVLPSNTIAVLSALSQEVFDSGRFGADVTPRLVVLDDTIQGIDARRLARRYLGPNRRAVAVLAGVQSNQFPRASDLAVRLKAAGFEVMIGGFHVSGAIALSPTMPPECQALLDQGITLVKGEVEDVWGDLLEAAWQGRLLPFYDIRVSPDISHAPTPEVNRRYQRQFVYPFMATMDTSRGCPFNCSFCTIIHVQGRTMRCRAAESVLRRVEENHRRSQIDFYFFTDDNFARNRHWEAIFEGLIALREEKGIVINFMMQVDTQAWKIPGFIEKAARAGCTQIYLGIESLNADNLAAAHKKQNVVDEMAAMVQAWHEAGCACHASYIIGFPFDSPESVARDVERLKSQGFDQCSFFMLTPLPGSEDHARMVAEGIPLDGDYNRYDSMHETFRLPLFDPGEWAQAYRDAWRRFFNPEHMREVLKRCNPNTYWGIFKNYMWYRNAMFEEIHPMISGFWRLKPREDKRPGYAVENPIRHFLRRFSEGFQTVRFWGKLFLELQDLWLQTRIHTDSPWVYLSVWRARFGENLSEWPEAIRKRARQMARALAGKEGWAKEGWRTLEERGAQAREMWRQIEEQAARTMKQWDDSLETQGTRAREMWQSLGERGAQARGWLQENASELSDRCRTRFAGLCLSGSEMRGRIARHPFCRLMVRWNSRGRMRLMTSRAQLDAYWARLCQWAREKRFVRLSLETPRIGLNVLREARLSVTFLVYFLHELTCE